MKRNKFVVLFAVLVLILVSLACNAVTGGGDDGGGGNDNSGFSFTTANIQNAHMARDENDSVQTDVYEASDPTFYCIFELKNAPDDTVVKGVWTLVSAEGYEDNIELDAAEITGSDDVYTFSLNSSTDPWPVGQYKIDLYIDDNLVQTLDFEVQ